MYFFFNNCSTIGDGTIGDGSVWYCFGDGGEKFLGVLYRSSALIRYYGFEIIEDTPLGVFGGCWEVLLFLMVAIVCQKFSTSVVGVEK